MMVMIRDRCSGSAAGCLATSSVELSAFLIHHSSKYNAADTSAFRPGRSRVREVPFLPGFVLTNIAI